MKELKAEIRHDSKLNVTKIDMGFEASIHLFRQWQDQAVSGLMAAIASKKISKVSREDAIAHEICAKSADTVLKHARCVSELLQKPQIRIQVPRDRDTRTLFSRLKPQQIHQPAKPLERFSKTIKFPAKTLQRQKIYETLSLLKSKKSSRFEKFTKRNRKIKKSQQSANLNNPIQQRTNETQKWREKSIINKIGAFEVVKNRRKRYIIKSAKNYQLQDPSANMTPFGLIAKQLTRRILNFKNKTIATS
uniref:Uncharacterized protein n=1 Tax=Panagrolaimus sp. PS1159 TaxID=55785 RepID=A0AC35FK37_9BILA